MTSGHSGRRWRAAHKVGLPLAAGALIGVSLPPFNWWPLGIAGAGLAVSGLYGRTVPGRLAAGMLVGIGQFAISCTWALQFNTAGYVALAIVEAAFYAVASVLVPPGRGRLPASVAALTLAEWARQTWPFGGLPLGGIALGQASGPIGLTARLGGSLLVGALTFLAGACLAALCAGWVAMTPGPVAGTRDAESAGGAGGVLGGIGGVLGGIAGVAVVIGLVLVARDVPSASGVSPHAKGPVIRAALVQGGGRRGLNQLEVPPSVVFQAAVKATSRVPPGVSLIVWPEDVVSLTRPLAGSPEEAVLAALARRHHATLVAGVTETVGATRFRNEIVAFAPSGRIVASYEKVHRVPFGEYVPWRGLFGHVVSLRDVPRDAIPGHGTGMIVTPAGRFAVLVSYEVFFADRGRSGVRAGGEVVLVPTNTSSYSTDQAPAQEIAASRLQAIEEGRYVLQVAPTGYSAVIDPSGDVLAQTALSKRAVLVTSIPRLRGSTIFVTTGDVPVLLAALAALLCGWVTAVSRRGKRPRHRRTSPSR